MNRICKIVMVVSVLFFNNLDAQESITNNTPDGVVGQNALNVSRSTITSTDVTSYDKGILSNFINYNIPFGIKDRGYKIAVDASSYSSIAGFAGTLKFNYGLWARAGIHTSGANAVMENVYAVNAELMTRQGTVNNGYGVYIHSPYTTGNIINQYDLYASSPEAKNYFAGKVGIGTTTPSELMDVKGNVQLQSGHGGAGSFGKLQWRNSIAYSSTPRGYIETRRESGKDNGIMDFATSSSTNIAPEVRMTIDGNGKVGIGTSTPNARLEVYDGDLRIQSKVQYSGRKLTISDNLNSQGHLGVLEVGGQLFPGIQIRTLSNGNLGLRTDGFGSQGNIQFFTAGTNERMRINSDGAVGIGTISPGARLDVVSNSNFIRKGRILLDPGYVGSPQGGTDRYNWIQSEYTTNSSYDLGIGGTDYNDGVPKMMIKGDGKVGIGLLNPDKALTVNGTVHSKEVLVDMAGALGPDYVFEPDYDLMTLDNLKSFIEKERHLPEVPSAKEMEEHGINLKEMNLLLLKKIEEMTLHMIAMEERLIALENK